MERNPKRLNLRKWWCRFQGLPHKKVKMPDKLASITKTQVFPRFSGYSEATAEKRTLWLTQHLWCIQQNDKRSSSVDPYLDRKNLQWIENCKQAEICGGVTVARKENQGFQSTNFVFNLLFSGKFCSCFTCFLCCLDVCLSRFLLCFPSFSSLLFLNLLSCSSQPDKSLDPSLHVAFHRVCLVKISIYFPRWSCFACTNHQNMNP